MSQAHFGFGTLGLSGRYGSRTLKEVDEALEFAVAHYNFIDTATVYGDSFSINAALSRYLTRDGDCSLINKYGANLSGPGDLDALKREFFNDLEAFSVRPPATVLIHRPAAGNIERDIEFSQIVNDALPNSRFGITTNSAALLNLYASSMTLDVVQVALNFCDYSQNNDLLVFAKDKNMVVQARSVLSSGLLSGSYDQSSVPTFRDPLRQRFSESDQNIEIIRKRLLSVHHLRKLHADFNAESINTECSFSQFVYSLFGFIDEVDEVIVGGSRLYQIKENSDAESLIDAEMAYSMLTEDLLRVCSAPYI